MAYKNKSDLVAYRKSHRKEANERARLWRLAHPGAAAAKAKEWREKNWQHYLKTQRIWKAGNRAKINAAQKEWRAKHDYENSQQRLGQKIRQGLAIHGMTIADYLGLLEKQGGKCAICGSFAPRMKKAKRLYVDHCHVTDMVRGLLCCRCNTALSMADDSPERLRAAAAYLERPNDSGIVRGEARSLLESSRR